MDQLEAPFFSGHESFPLRYGWLPKAVALSRKGPDAFGREEEAMVKLGVGKNMVRSIRHWAIACGVLERAAAGHSRSAAVRPSQFGEMLFGGKGTDPYLDDPATLWLLHWKLASQATAPTTWFWAFNVFSEQEFTKQQLLKGLGDLVERKAWKRIAPSTLNRDVDCFLRTTCPREPANEPPLRIPSILRSSNWVC